MTPDQIVRLVEGAAVFLLGVLALLAGHGKLLNWNTPTFNAADWHRRNDHKYRVIGWILVAVGVIMAIPR
jgi:uncharacterized protein YjeT (DUF2065 family)